MEAVRHREIQGIGCFSNMKAGFLITDQIICSTCQLGRPTKWLEEVKRSRRERKDSNILMHSVCVAQLTVDVFQDLRVGLVFRGVAAQRAFDLVQHGRIRAPVLGEVDEVWSSPVEINQQHHLIEDVAGEEVVLHVGDLHGHGDAVVIGPLLRWRYHPERSNS